MHAELDIHTLGFVTSTHSLTQTVTKIERGGERERERIFAARIQWINTSEVIAFSSAGSFNKLEVGRFSFTQNFTKWTVLI